MNYIIIDVREPDEFQTGHVVGALNVPLSEIRQDAALLHGLAKDSNIIVYCRTGNRSSLARNILSSLGFTNVINGTNKEHVEATYNIS